MSKIAYSYSRFSTGEQAEGDSQRRQDVGVDRWLQQNPEYALDTNLTFKDVGRSGLHGAHLRGSGALRRFLDCIESGVVKPGSVLLLENLDRLSRMNLDNSLQLARSILVKGVDIITFLPLEHFTKKGLDDLMQVMKLVLYFQRSHEESKIKSERAKSNWEQKRSAIQAKAIVTATRPFWLNIVQDGVPISEGRGKLDLSKPAEFVFNEKLEILKLMFFWADPQGENKGSNLISQELLRRGMQIGRARTATTETICRILADRRAIGEYAPRHRRDENYERPSAGEVVEGYYPAAISIEQFYRVQQAMRNRAKHGNGRKGDGLSNLFGGLLFDARDSQRMYLRGPANARFVMNSGALTKNGGKWIGLDYRTLERALLGCCREIRASELATGGDTAGKLATAETNLAECKHKIARTQERLDGAKDAAEEEVYSDQLTRLVRQRKALETEVDKARSEVASQPVEQIKELQTLLDVLESTSEEDREQVRFRIAALISCVVDSIYLWIQRKGKRTRYIKRAWIWVTFKGGRMRKIYIAADGVAVTMPYESINAMGAPEFNVPTDGGWE